VLAIFEMLFGSMASSRWISIIQIRNEIIISHEFIESCLLLRAHRLKEEKKKFMKRGRQKSVGIKNVSPGDW
jgi:hypothetical protein